jgi:hypothetical protein
LFFSSQPESRRVKFTRREEEKKIQTYTAKARKSTNNNQVTNNKKSEAKGKKIVSTISTSLARAISNFAHFFSSSSTSSLSHFAASTGETQRSLLPFLARHAMFFITFHRASGELLPLSKQKSFALGSMKLLKFLRVNYRNRKAF